MSLSVPPSAISTDSLKVKVSRSTVPSELASPVTADTITGFASSLTVISLLVAEALVPSVMLLDVP